MQVNEKTPMGAGEASDRLGISRDSLVRMVAKGVIKQARKMPGVSGAWLFDREEIEQLAAGCRRCGQPVAKPGQRRGDGELDAQALFCAACIDRCHEATDFAHICQICATPDEAARHGWKISA